MNVYQLMPTSCYDIDDGGTDEVWSAEMTDSADEGCTSCNEFYDESMSDSGVEQMGWYNVMGRHDCTESVPAAPHLLSLDAHQLRFFDDDSSAENETFFGRTLDTISEEDEDDVMRQAAETDAEDEENRHQHSTKLARFLVPCSRKKTQFADLSIILILWHFTLLCVEGCLSVLVHKHSRRSYMMFQ